MTEPTFTIEPLTKLSTDCFMIRVQVSTDGDIWWYFYGTTERQAKAKANAFIADKRAKFLKSLAAKESRRAGRIRQSLKASRAALTPHGGEG